MSQDGGSVFSVLVCVGLVGTYNPVASQVPSVEQGLGAAEVVYDQCYIKTVNLQQVGEEGAIALGVQPHGPHVLTGESGVSTCCYLWQGLEDAVIQLHKKPKMGLKAKASIYVVSKE